MENVVVGLGLSLESGTNGGTQPEASATRMDILCQAITQKLCVAATYNGKALTLAPHIVFTKHDDPFLGAVTVEQDGKKPKMAKLGAFKLAGLTDIVATTREFVPQRSFRADDPQYSGNTVCILQPA